MAERTAAAREAVPDDSNATLQGRVRYVLKARKVVGNLFLQLVRA